MNEENNFSCSDVLFDISNLPSRNYNLLLEGANHVQGKGLDASAISFFIETFISRGARNVSIMSPLSINQRWKEELKTVYRDRVDFQNLESATISTKALFSSIYEETKTYFDGFHLHYCKENLSDELADSLNSTSLLLNKLFVGIENNLILDIDVSDFNNQLEFLKKNLVSPDSRFRLSQLQGLLLSYNPCEIESLLIRPKNSSEIMDVFSELVQEDIYKSMSNEINKSRTIKLREKSLIKYSKMVREVSKLQKYKGFFSIGHKIISLFLPLPKLDLEAFLKVLKTENELPVISKMKPEFDKALERWASSETNVVPILDTDKIEGYEIKGIQSLPPDKSKSGLVKAVVESPLNDFDSTFVTAIGLVGSLDGKSTQFQLM